MHRHALGHAATEAGDLRAAHRMRPVGLRPRRHCERVQRSVMRGTEQHIHGKCWPVQGVPWARRLHAVGAHYAKSIIAVAAHSTPRHEDYVK